MRAGGRVAFTQTSPLSHVTALCAEWGDLICTSLLQTRKRTEKRSEMLLAEVLLRRRS